MSSTTEKEKLDWLIAKSVSNFARKSEEIDPDVDSNLMVMALTIVDVIKKRSPEAFDCFDSQYREKILELQ